MQVTGNVAVIVTDNVGFIELFFYFLHDYVCM